MLIERRGNSPGVLLSIKQEGGKGMNQKHLRDYAHDCVFVVDGGVLPVALEVLSVSKNRSGAIIIVGVNRRTGKEYTIHDNDIGETAFFDKMMAIEKLAACHGEDFTRALWSCP